MLPLPEAARAVAPHRPLLPPTIQTVHTPTNRYLCQCGCKKYITFKVLRAHMRNHGLLEDGAPLDLAQFEQVPYEQPTTAEREFGGKGSDAVPLTWTTHKSLVSGRRQWVDSNGTTYYTKKKAIAARKKELEAPPMTSSATKKQAKFSHFFSCR